MRAAVFHSVAAGLTVEDLPDPVPADGEVVLHVTSCGICGSDLHAIPTVAPPGTVMGHEFAGEIVDVGAGVDTGRWPVGLHVTGRPMVSCGSCLVCLSGRADRCPQFGLIGNERPGAWAEYVAVPARELWTSPAAVTPAEAALVEPLAVARRALRRAGRIEGENVLILGGGPVGQAVAIWARALDAALVAVSEPDADRRALAVALGAEALDPSEAGPAEAFSELAGEPPGVVIECVGKPGLLQDAMIAAGFEGRVVIVGVCVAMDSFLPFIGLAKELDLRFAIYYEPGDFTETIAALDDHRLHVGGLVTGTVGLDDLPERYAAMVAHATGGKVLVTP